MGSNMLLVEFLFNENTHLFFTSCLRSHDGLVDPHSDLHSFRYHGGLIGSCSDLCAFRYHDGIIDMHSELLILIMDYWLV